MSTKTYFFRHKTRHLRFISYLNAPIKNMVHQVCLFSNPSSIHRYCWCCVSIRCAGEVQTKAASCTWCSLLLVGLQKKTGCSKGQVTAPPLPAVSACAWETMSATRTCSSRSRYVCTVVPSVVVAVRGCSSLPPSLHLPRAVLYFHIN